jgi:beta-glucosidase
VSRIDDAVRRILLLKLKLGLFENAYSEPAAVALFGNPDYQTLALDAAREAMTLLKNDNNILPLAKNAKILIAGPAAQSISALNGCWSYTWQGKIEEWYPADSKTILQTIAEKVGAANVVTTTAKGFDKAANFDIGSLKAAAVNVDVIVLCIGEDAHAESPGTIPDLALPDNQVELVNAAAATGKPVIIVLTEGRPRLITGIEPKVKGILMSYWSGKKSAEAISDVLFGDVNPSGKLPFSYPRSMGEMVMYDRKHTEDIREIFNENMTTDGYKPLYPFGFGLSYTSFEYSDITLSSKTLKAAGKITVSITVKNTGNREGMHTVELYSHDLFASITPSMRRLRGFKKISLKAGESKSVSFTLDRNDLAFVNAQLKTVTEPGDFEVMIGNKKAGFTYEQ